ncbi:MAG: hypothetical protein ND866_00175 [Pyrinomonadaceae bacterium]|nr:hypothetical protein [Pyrinomonadaceae bacterium]
MNKPSTRTNKPRQPINKPTKEITCDVMIRQRRIRVAALLNTAATLGAAVLVAAMSGAKRPIVGGD